MSFSDRETTGPKPFTAPISLRRRVRQTGSGCPESGFATPEQLAMNERWLLASWKASTVLTCACSTLVRSLGGCRKSWRRPLKSLENNTYVSPISQERKRTVPAAEAFAARNPINAAMNRNQPLLPLHPSGRTVILNRVARPKSRGPFSWLRAAYRSSSSFSWLCLRSPRPRTLVRPDEPAPSASAREASRR